MIPSFFRENASISQTRNQEYADFTVEIVLMDCDKRTIHVKNPNESSWVNFASSLQINFRHASWFAATVFLNSMFVIVWF